jgi:hypothetical protein
VQRQQELGALFRIERTLADAPRKKRESIRAKRSRPIVDAFFSGCDSEADSVLDETPIARGSRRQPCAHDRRASTAFSRSTTESAP